MSAAKKGKTPVLTESLRLALSDTGARKRILEVNQRDKRSLSDIDQHFRELDRLIEYLVKHRDDPVPLDVSEPPTRKQELTDLDLALAPSMPSSPAPTHDERPAVTPEVAPEKAAPTVAESPTAGQSPELPAPKAAPAAKAKPEPPRTWQRPPGSRPIGRVDALLQDVMWLLEIKDGEGMLISLERLLVASQVEGELETFVEENETKLLNVYESYLGPFSKTVKGTQVEDESTMPPAFFDSPKVACISELVREGLTIDSLLKVSPYSALETCCVVSQLRRCGLASVDG